MGVSQVHSGRLGISSQNDSQARVRRNLFLSRHDQVRISKYLYLSCAPSSSIFLSISRGHVAVMTLIVVVGIGALTYYAFTAGVVQATNTGSGTQGTNGEPLYSAQNTAYTCEKPAANSQNFCDQLPAGYRIAPKLSNGPNAYCRAGMTDSACSLLKQTFSNGVCDPNETVATSPLDCGCTGSLTSDPFTGRCGAPATVCQLQVVQEAVEQQKQNG